MKLGTGLTLFAERFPERFFDVGICEQHAVTFAVGLALQGFIPVCAIYSTFLQRAFDQLIHDVALNKAKVIFAIDRAGLVGEDGPTHHGAFDLSYLRLIPNFIIMIPRDENQLQHMLYSALKYNSPTAIRYPRGYGEGVSLDWEFKQIPLGKAEILKEGKDISIFACGPHLYTALSVAKELEEKEGLSVEVIDVRFLKPLDENTLLNSIQKTKKALVIEENTCIGGLFSAVSELIVEKTDFPVKLKKIALPDKFIEHGDLPTLRKVYGFDKEHIKKCLLSLV